MVEYPTCVWVPPLLGPEWISRSMLLFCHVKSFARGGAQNSIIEKIF